MAHSYKNIVITPNIGANTDPFVQFSGGNTTVNTDVTLRVYPDSNGTLSFEGSAGQLFSITNDLTGSIFSVNDVSGIPLVEVNVASQQITLGEFYGNVGVGKSSSTSSIYKLDVNGTINASNVLINGNAITGSVSSLTPANNYSNTLYTSALSFANGVANSANLYGMAYANGVANSANAYTVTVGTAANVTHWIYANGVANSANAYAVTVGAAGNTAAYAFANGVANSANAYAVTVGAASNNWANTLGTNTALSYSWTNTHTFSANVFYRNTSNIVWITNSASTTSNVTLRNYPDSNGTLSFEGSAGQLFSITNDLTGSIFSVNDVSGIPLIEVNVSSQQINFGEFYGNVGIGKTTSTSSIYKLDVNGTVNASNYLINTFPVAALSYANGVANSANAYAVTVGAAANTFANTKVAAVTSNSNSRIWANTSIDGNNNENVFLDLSTSGVTATTYGGTTQIPSFTVDAYGRLTFAGNNAFTSGGVTITNENASASTFYPVFTLTTTGSMSTANVGTTKLTYVPSTGTLSSTIFNSTSDINRKENIQRIANAVETINKINGYTFNWKDNGQESIGVIAQEIEKELPCLVADSKDGKSVNYNGLVAILIEVVKKQQKDIEEIKKLLNKKNI